MLCYQRTFLLYKKYFFTVNVLSPNLIFFLSFCVNNSIVLVAKDNLIVHNPTNKQLVLALQVEPSINVWKFLKCKLSADTFYMILYILVTTDKTWLELNFIDCELGDIECEVVCNYLDMLKPTSLIRRLNFSRVTLPSSITSDSSTLARILIIWDIEKLIFSDQCQYKFYESLMEILRKHLYCHRLVKKQFFHTVSCTTVKKHDCYICNIEWTVIATLKGFAITSLTIINCQLYENEFCSHMDNLPNLSQLFVVNSSLSDEVVCINFRLKKLN